MRAMCDGGRAMSQCRAQYPTAGRALRNASEPRAEFEQHPLCPGARNARSRELRSKAGRGVQKPPSVFGTSLLSPTARVPSTRAARYVMETRDMSSESRARCPGQARQV